VTTSAAGEITVRRCVVRVVRRGGWSWGPDPGSLVQQAMDALPDLLAARFDDQLTGEGSDLEITEPVVLSVRLGRLSSRLSLADMVIDPTAVAVPAVESSPSATVQVDSTDESTVDVISGDAWLAPTPAALFGELAERGDLVSLLALLPVESLRLYVTALLDDPADEPPAVVTESLATELARHLSLPVPVPATRDILAQLVASLPGVVSEPAAEAGVSRAEVAETPSSTGETRVSSVLPFLLVGQLARTGYLDAIGPALAGAGLVAEAPLFAAALAFTVLGTRRTAADNAVAAVFAGLESIPDLAGFALRVRPALPVLDAVLALSLCRGHDPADPLLITGVDEGLLLVDAQGMFPVAWAPSVAGLLPHWEACGRPPVLVCNSTLPRSCLRDLASVRAQLVTDVRPLRDDPLFRMPWRTPLWTFGAPSPRLAAELPAYAERLDTLVRALFVERFAELDRSVGLAGSLALGMIAWTLWHEREPPDPVLALTRFADLEATIRFTPDAVRVRVPLGRRHTDLWQAGVLADVPDVVWLGGRTLTFSGG
jgi:hypothetical protein